jgi:hypothetical protein
METAKLHPHRRNEEGSYDSICRTCFVTIAQGMAESELAAFEEAHECDPYVLTEHAYFART